MRTALTSNFRRAAETSKLRRGNLSEIRNLCEWKGETFMIFNWGCQHETEALALAVSPVALEPFLQGGFAPASAASTPAPAVAY